MSTGRRASTSSHTRSGRSSGTRRKTVRRKKKKNNILPVILLMAVILGGLIFAFKAARNNEGKTSFDVSTAVFEKSGKLQVTTVESFDKDYYNADDLEAYVRNEVKTANLSTKKVDLKAITVEDGVARMEIVYDSPDDYQNFNSYPVYYGSLKGARSAGFNMDALMSAPSQKDSAKIFSNADFDAYADKTVAVICEKMNIVVPRDILFASKNLNVTGKRTAEAVSDISDETPAIIIMK